MPAHSPGVLQGTAKVADRVHPSTKALPERWERPEEWYNFDKNPRGDVHVLVTADETTYDPGGSARWAPTTPSPGAATPRAARSGPPPWATTRPPTAKPPSATMWSAASSGRPATEPGDCGGTVWTGYEKVTLDDNTADPMELDVAADGRVFYAQRDGAVKIFDPATHATVTAGKLDVYTGGEDGLVGMELDPAFKDNHWIYLYYAPAGATEDINRLSRFTVTDNKLDLASEKKLLDVPAYRDRTFPEPGHTGGAVEFGPDRTLYLSTGDDTPPNLDSNWQGYAPLDWRPGKQMLDAARTAGNTNDLRGKILRIKPTDEGGYTVPGAISSRRARTRPGPRSTPWASATRSASPSTRRRIRPRLRLRPRPRAAGRRPRSRGPGRVQRHQEGGQLRLAVLPRQQPGVRPLQPGHPGGRRQVRLRQADQPLTQQHRSHRPAAAPAA